ncbi:D-alanyl-D-alanine carboxypeptidase/D-alanyl-D-alanine endopeptidase [Lyngbya confervoides]|uniref:D-alanyl-D-alanine carboxypeptidase/D-alanyl-D-alanine-endopeptidase n=1 Tax=Lyngbya confervoides BDU141951 TaxID=1574623 RepID=A0ABD4T6F3_9CYAN|nr:D-alanyl-D-alanine carboxypeptidase/D-alanyl-D-alanine-endopeptidase [Lyngbya confervoides]MCM1984351.1 D-alanyl-D-alanine carboxypeptidase/D-alanyl-D-alanine-endopeptidase [Lyngbya confervoides BDU141951]
MTLASLGAVFLLQMPPGAQSAGAAEPDARTNLQIQACRREIKTAVETHIHQPQMRRTRWGISVKLGQAWSGQSLYQHQADQLFLPASTAKLLTTAATLQAVAPNTRIETPVWGSGSVPALKHLRIVGQGDPSITATELTQLARHLQRLGVRSIGTLIADDRQFTGSPLVPSWAWEDLQTSDGVPVNSLSFYQNSLPLDLKPQSRGQALLITWPEGTPLNPPILVNQTRTVSRSEPEFIEVQRNLGGTTMVIQGQLREGSAAERLWYAIADPAQLFLHRLQTLLREHKIQVDRSIVWDDRTPPPEGELDLKAEQPLGQLSSPPLTALLTEINRNSNNFYAESLLRRLSLVNGSAIHKAPVNGFDLGPSSLDQGLATLEMVLTKAGIDPSGYRLADGSGLSRQNLVSPNTLTDTLLAMERSPHFEPFRNSLAIAGEQGTLRQRFQGTPLVGHLWAKTGTLKGTVTLAGYLQKPTGPRLIVSIMANASDLPGLTLRQTLDQILVKIAQFPACQSIAPSSSGVGLKPLYNR